MRPDTLSKIRSVEGRGAHQRHQFAALDNANNFGSNTSGSTRIR